jgi:hypothetical protein
VEVNVDQDSMAVLDDLNAGIDTIEIDHWDDSELKTRVGVFVGLDTDGLGNWIIQTSGRPDVKLIDVTEIRRIK